MLHDPLERYGKVDSFSSAMILQLGLFMITLMAFKIILRSSDVAISGNRNSAPGGKPRSAL
ncbi:unnamed protein product, partial [Ceratitis capitata]